MLPTLNATRARYAATQAYRRVAIGVIGTERAPPHNASRSFKYDHDYPFDSRIPTEAAVAGPVGAVRRFRRA
jgi:hypothetical protein